MTRTKSILAACLSLALVSSSLGAAPSAMAQTLRPADGLKARTDAPLTGKFIGFSVLRSSVTPAALKTPARTPYFKPGFANAANKPQKPTASSTLQTMGTELGSQGSTGDLGRYFTGERFQPRTPVAVDAAGAGEAKATLTASASTDKEPVPSAKQTVPAPKTQGVTASLNPWAIAGIAAAAVAVVVGVWTWMRGRQKNSTWENSKSNQDIIALEKARRDNDAKTLGEIKTEARGRQTRMDERIANARSAGQKDIELKEGKTMKVKDAEAFAAFDGLAAARAELNENAVSADPKARVGGELPATWQGRLGGLDAQASQAGFEGNLALQLKTMGGELARQDQAASKYEKDFSNFNKYVPGLFGGRLKDMEARGRSDLSAFQASEIQAEKATFVKFNTAMRGRVSGRLAGKDAEYQGHLSRLEDLNQAADGTLKSAVDMARQVDKDLADMARHEHARAYNLMLAAQNERVEVPVYDKNGRQIGTDIEDHSATYKALVASETAEAQASAASARAGVKALSTIIPLLHKDPVLKKEGLTFALPSNANTRVGSGGSVFFDFWMPASWNFFATMFSESQANQARGSFAPIKGGLESVMSEVQSRQASEQRWTAKRIDQVLDHEMSQAGKGG
ncbi:MAG: hypothetical protein A2X36_17555 [Elusimicrobia bacterium GWA2_69_24]|nr:MAG: hypothetical protein A2X36_17555 [Elusimicrobia bacterium GWA2_69_24]